jgi:hypothetical protein
MGFMESGGAENDWTDPNAQATSHREETEIAPNYDHRISA